MKDEAGGAAAARRFIVHLSDLVHRLGGSFVHGVTALYILIALLAAAAGYATFVAVRVRRQCAAVAQRLREMSAAKRLSPVTADELAACGTGAAGQILGAVNELIHQADTAVSDAALKARELEIHLRVATAERQHAEAIIYSISDAVLVTDTFDELVLANESAARAFDFDLADATRSPVDQVLKDQKVIDLIREMRQSNSTSGRRIVEHTINTVSGGDRTF